MHRALVWSMGLVLGLAPLAGLSAATPAAPPSSPELQAAREHLQKGRYAEAQEAYESLLKANPDAVDAALGLSRVFEQTGRWGDAQQTAGAMLDRRPEDVRLINRVAELQFATGDYVAAQASLDAALQADENSVRAHVLQGDLFAETGRPDEALEEYRWCVRYYNRAQPTDAETLLAIADGSLQYARWKGVSSIFNFVLNTLCPDALKADPLAWEAANLSGRLLLEKYNRAEAVPEFHAAAAINAQSATVQVSLAEASMQERNYDEAVTFIQRALEIAPQHPAALLLKSDLELAEGNIEAAMEAADNALAVNPSDQRALARRAAALLMQDGIPSDAELDALFAGQPGDAAMSRFGELTAALLKRNPRPGTYYAIIGESLEARLKLPAAERFYRQAVAVMPVLSAPRNALGLLAMRTGRIDEAEQILNEAFRADPYHVRISNMRKVVGVLKDYEVVSTDHFVIRADARDALLAECMSGYLEEIYPELTELYGFEPESRTQFEIYSDAKGQTAHQWFSARITGLPWIQTIGASTGMMVALASPTAQPEPYNWGRVVRHEFVHILTLQQTGFNIPHWYTEALAVRTEGLTMPESWEDLLLARVPDGRTFTLDTINRGFQHPEGPDDWNMAYCQSRFYAQYMEETYGVESLTRLVDAYRRNLSTPDAIREVFGVTLAEFETGYRKLLEQTVDRLRRERPVPPPDLETARLAYEMAMDDPAAQGAYAYALRDTDADQSRQLAQRALEQDPRQPLAAVALARFAYGEDRIEDAIAILEEAYDPESPHPVLLPRLAELLARADRLNDAAALYDIGVASFPREGELWKGLTDVLRRLDDSDRLRDVLLQLANRNGDDVDVRRQLAQLAADAGDHAAAIRWSREVLFIDVRDRESHERLARAYAAVGETEKAAREAQIVADLASAPQTDAPANENP